MSASFLTTVFLPIVVMLGMLGLGISLTIEDFKQILVHPKAVLVGLLNQLLFVPLTGFLLALLLPLSPELAAGLIIIAAAPGGVASNVTTFLLEGDSALSISLTTLSNLLAFITLPLWTSLALYLFMDTAESISVSLGQIIIQIVVLTLIPIGLGLLLRARWPQLGPKLERPLRVGLALLILVAIVGSLVSESDNVLYYLAEAGAAAIMLCLTTILLGFVSAWLFKLDLRTRITIANEAGIQNVPLALTITATILANPLITIAPAAYGFVQIFLLSIILGVAFGPWSAKLLPKPPVELGY
ncbi:MAG: bile acid:sodium symporter [Anaerolineaceae bacterium]|nr:bile acid:sodium symporter [Anaerolineaceae bacterium]MCB9097942.1 bile acid:sodium symporter [Anaerolineales bacterium]